MNITYVMVNKNFLVRAGEFSPNEHNAQLVKPQTNDMFLALSATNICNSFVCFLGLLKYRKPKKLQSNIKNMNSEHEQVKVVLCGPPHSGKSVLREGLKQAIKRLPEAPYPYVITATPDGEGAWFSETAQHDAELARKLKDDYKSKFTPEFAKVRADWVEKATTQLTIVDVGGKTSDENRMIMAPATHAVILAGDINKIPE